MAVIKDGEDGTTPLIKNKYRIYFIFQEYLSPMGFDEVVVSLSQPTEEMKPVEITMDLLENDNKTIDMLDLIVHAQTFQNSKPFHLLLGLVDEDGSICEEYTLRGCEFQDIQLDRNEDYDSAKYFMKVSYEKWTKEEK